MYWHCKEKLAVDYILNFKQDIEREGVLLYKVAPHRGWTNDHLLNNNGQDYLQR